MNRLRGKNLITEQVSESVLAFLAANQTVVALDEASGEYSAAKTGVSNHIFSSFSLLPLERREKVSHSEGRGKVIRIIAVILKLDSKVSVCSVGTELNYADILQMYHRTSPPLICLKGTTIF